MAVARLHISAVGTLEFAPACKELQADGQIEATPSLPMKMNRLWLCVLAAIVLSGGGCAEGPLWEREGGVLNPWGGEFLDVHWPNRLPPEYKRNGHLDI